MVQTTKLIWSFSTSCRGPLKHCQNVWFATTNEPTLITPSSTLIDLIFTSCQDNVLCSGVFHVGISDHSLVCVCRKISISYPSKGINLINYRQFKHLNSTTIRYKRIFRLQWYINRSPCPVEDLTGPLSLFRFNTIVLKCGWTSETGLRGTLLKPDIIYLGPVSKNEKLSVIGKLSLLKRPAIKLSWTVVPKSNAKLGKRSMNRHLVSQTKLS